MLSAKTSNRKLVKKPAHLLFCVYSHDLLRYDPHHLLFGADWSKPWAGYQWSEAVNELGFDVSQVENYKPNPKDSLQDIQNRIGMPFAPLINSQPMYLLSGQEIVYLKA